MKIPDLIWRLTGEDETDRIYAAEELGLTDSFKAIEPLMERVIREPSRKVRESIFSAFEKIGHPQVLVQLAEFLGSEDAFLRNSAVSTFQLKGTCCAKMLLKQMSHFSPDVRKFALDAAAGMEGPLVAQIYELAITDEDVNVRIAALEHIRNNHREEFKAQVEELFSSTDEPMVTSAALAALLTIGNEDSWDCILERYPNVEKVWGWDLGNWARALGAFGPANQIHLFYGVLKKGGAAIADHLIDAMELFQNRHSIPDIEPEFMSALLALDRAKISGATRFALLRLLGSFEESPTIAQYLFELFDDHSTMVRMGAIEGAKRLGTPWISEKLMIHITRETDPEILDALEIL
jgi:HEAT repeat protein